MGGVGSTDDEVNRVIRKLSESTPEKRTSGHSRHRQCVETRDVLLRHDDDESGSVGCGMCQ
jgi:hypothetical protein